MARVKKTSTWYSVCFPGRNYIHLRNGRIVARSLPGFAKGLVHYNQRGRVVSKTVLSFLGEPNHYDTNGRCIGYSRSAGIFKMVHYDMEGMPIGWTYRILWVFLFHAFYVPKPFLQERKTLVSAKHHHANGK